MYETEMRELRNQIARLEAELDKFNRQLRASSDRFAQAAIRREISEIEGQIARQRERLREIEGRIAQEREAQRILASQKSEAERWLQHFDMQVKSILDRYGKGWFGLKGHKYQVTGGVVERTYGGECGWEIRWGLTANFSSHSYSSILVELALDTQAKPKAFRIGGVEGGMIGTSPQIGRLEDRLVNTVPEVQIHHESYSSSSDNTPCCC